MSEPIFEPALLRLADIAAGLMEKPTPRSQADREKLANLAYAFGGLSACIQRLAPEHDQAGFEADCIADRCAKARHE